MKHKFIYTVYSFRQPEELDYQTYRKIKRMLDKNPGLKLNPKSDFIETFGDDFKLLAIGLLSSLLTLILQYILPYISNSEINSYILGTGYTISALLLVTFLLVFFPSIFSYITYVSDKRKYYDQLKIDIMESYDHSCFMALRMNNGTYYK